MLTGKGNFDRYKEAHTKSYLEMQASADAGKLIRKVVVCVRILDQNMILEFLFFNYIGILVHRHSI